MAQTKKGKKPAARVAKAAKTPKKPTVASAPHPVAAVAPTARRRVSIGSMEQWNKWLAGLYALQALAIVLIATGKAFPVTANFLGVDTFLSQTAGHTVYAPAMRHLFDVPLAQVLGLILAISAALHLMLSSYLNRQYTSWLEQGINPIRWLDGAFSASLLPLAIALAAGLSEITTLLMLVVLGFVTHLLGMCMELYNRPYRADTAAKDTKPLVLMAVTGVTTWFVLGLYLLFSVIFGHGLPWHAWVSYLTALVFVALITIVLIRNYRRVGRLKQYQTSDRIFMLLSFAAKSIIAWELFAAVLRP